MIGVFRVEYGVLITDQDDVVVLADDIYFQYFG
jgi:hypothetical protein